MSEKFLCEIAQDAADYARLRQSSAGHATAQPSGLKVTIDDLTAALDERGIEIHRSPYHL